MENIMENNVEEQEIWRPENDKRLYQGLRLANEMNVVLIHDPEVEIAAAALNINIGSAIEIKMGHPAGLARLFQRILYLSDRQPQPKSFNNFVKRHNGEVDAETRTSCADYYFNINSSHLKDALGYFAKFFCEQAPSCSHLTIESEYNVILKIEETNKLHDEWKLPKFIKYIRFNHESKASDKWREYEPEKSLTEEPAIDTKMLEKFYKDYYYSEDMTLCVLGKESLDELKEMVVEFFSPVRERTIPDSEIFPQVTMAPPSFVHKIYYVPNKDCNQLHLVAHPVYYNTRIPNVPDIFAYLLKYNGEKSLLSVLKAKGWATSIGAGLLTEIHRVFLVTIDLTEKGLDHVDEVVTLFFEYVHMLRKENNDYKRIVNEYKKIQELQLYFEEKKLFPKYVRLYAHQIMCGRPKKHVLREKPIPLKWHIEAMQCVFEPFLPPLRLSIYVASQKYKTLTDKSCDYYEYKIERVPSKTYARWIEDNNTLSKIFKFPSCNEFIPTDINIKETDEAEKHIRIIKKTKLLTFWHKKDDEFKEPKATMIFHFINPVVYVDTINANLALMFIRIINESLSECAYAAALVGLHWEFSTTNKGIQLKIHGFDNKLPNLVEKIFDQIINFEVEINKFEAHRQNNIDINKKELQEFQESSPHRQVQHYLSVILSNNMWQREDILKSSSGKYRKED
ncbi:PREDICTED: insulin-degrading enzyme-like [Vollenhovia emeryi]|uniref:insulin-degrading enzyme-like n=1 Tax=Vollenhovia emeryi TaxID=411798 RepID=UPI0005F4AA1E|nr:PREDICTED: insulin-degrading enzyme-like [Vollenhovia emeryi]